MPTSKARNPGIDLLRGVSILLVMLNHIGIRISLLKGALAGWLPRQALTDLTYNGAEAVFIFFVISGFLIATNTIERWGSLGAMDSRAFYTRRFARIMPCLAALVGILALLHTAHVPGYVIDRPRHSLGGAVGSAFGLCLNWYEGHTGYLPASWDVLWSLSIDRRRVPKQPPAAEPWQQAQVSAARAPLPGPGARARLPARRAGP